MLEALVLNVPTAVAWACGACWPLTSFEDKRIQKERPTCPTTIVHAQSEDYASGMAPTCAHRDSPRSSSIHSVYSVYHESHHISSITAYPLFGSFVFFFFHPFLPYLFHRISLFFHWFNNCPKMALIIGWGQRPTAPVAPSGAETPQREGELFNDTRQDLWKSFCDIYIYTWI